MAKCPQCGREVLRLVDERCGYCAREEYRRREGRHPEEREREEQLVDELWQQLHPRQVDRGLGWLRGLAKETTQGSYQPHPTRPASPSLSRTPNIANIPNIPPDPAPYIPVTFKDPRIIERLKFQQWRIQQGLLDDDLCATPDEEQKEGSVQCHED